MNTRDALTLEASILDLDARYAAAVASLKFTPDGGEYDALRAVWQRTADCYRADKAALLRELHAANGRVVK